MTQLGYPGEPGQDARRIDVEKPALIQTEVRLIPKSGSTGNNPKMLRVAELLLVLGIAFASSLLAAFHIYLRGFPAGSVSDAPWRLANGIIHESLALGVLLYVLFQQGRSIREIGLSFRWLDIPVSIAIFGASYLAFYFTYVVFYFLYFVATGHAPTFWSDVSQLMGSRLSVVAVIFILINPWFEELIVRAYVMNEVLGLGNNLWMAGILSVGLQSLYHLYQGIPNMILLTAHFSVFAFYYARSRRILPVILAHLYLDIFAFSHLFLHH